MAQLCHTFELEKHYRLLVFKCAILTLNSYLINFRKVI